MISQQWQPKEGVAELSDEHPYYTPDELELVEVEIPDEVSEETQESAEDRIAALEAAVASLVTTLNEVKEVTINE